MLFTRPRRFGKTLNLSMLRHFFDFKLRKENKKLFTNLNISKTKYMDTHFGEYPTIFISLKNILANNIEDFKEQLKIVIAKSYFDFIEVRDNLDEKYTEKFNDVYFEKSNNISFSLYNLMQYIYVKYKKKTILLIDEYDTPL